MKDTIILWCRNFRGVDLFGTYKRLDGCSRGAGVYRLGSEGSENSDKPLPLEILFLQRFSIALTTDIPLTQSFMEAEPERQDTTADFYYPLPHGTRDHFLVMLKFNPNPR